jgi:hypothetical protein
VAGRMSKRSRNLYGMPREREAGVWALEDIGVYVYLEFKPSNCIMYRNVAGIIDMRIVQR